MNLSDSVCTTENSINSELSNGNHGLPTGNINNNGKGYKFVFKSDKEKKSPPNAEKETSENNKKYHSNQHHSNKHHGNQHHNNKIRQLGHAVGKPFKFVFKKARPSHCHGLDEYLFAGVDRSHLSAQRSPFHNNRVSPQTSAVNINTPRQPGNYGAAFSGCHDWRSNVIKALVVL